LRFYPDLPILIVDNDSRDDSALYLDWKAITTPSVRVWHRTGMNSHGTAMDEAIRQRITTRYVLLLDSDIIIERGGFVEPMLAEFEKDNALYAIGTYMPVSFSNDGCGGPQFEGDVLHYAHPSCSIYDRDIYLTLPPFANHGAPCCYNNKEAQVRGYNIISWPIDDYVSHMSGASWTTPRTVWQNDHDVFVRPFVTFLTHEPGVIPALQAQTNQDFDIVTLTNMAETFYCVIPIQGKADPRYVQNDNFPAFYRVSGEYVCRIGSGIYNGYVAELKRQAIETRGANEINIGGAVSYRRNYWQEYVCLR
jgi:glycosyltransferase involved in cell wall biosynthesis